MSSSEEDLRTGHGMMDAHHDAMLRRIAELARNVDEEDAAGAAVALAGLWEETVSHFAAEDVMMEEHLYPERVAHRSAHHLFLEDLRELMRLVAEYGISAEVSEWALQRLPGWVKFHIQANDAPLAQFALRRSAARMLAAARGEQPPKSGRSDA
jgi:hemerythrin-like metal-binding protein